jgi:nucleoside-diphosphate-sugar epimerase
MEGEPLTVYGDGSQTRSLCYVDDEVRGLIALFDSELTGPVNLGNPDEYTVLQLARTVVDLLGSSSPIIHLPLPVDDPTRRRPDISLARSALGWEPTTRLRDGLALTAAFLAEEARVSAEGLAAVEGARSGNNGSE